MRSLIKRFIGVPSLCDLARKQLDSAQRDLLGVHLALEEHTAMREMLLARIERLTKYVEGCK